MVNGNEKFSDEEKGIDTLQMILNEIQEGICIIDCSDLSIIYTNRMMNELFGNSGQINKCYEGFMCLESPCMNCMALQLKNGETTICRHYFETLDRETYVKMKKMFWSDGREIIMVTFLGDEGQEELSNPILQKEPSYSSEYVRLNEQLYQSVVEQVKTIVFEYNYDIGKSYISTAFKKRFQQSNYDEDYSDIDIIRKYVYENDLKEYDTLFLNVSKEHSYSEIKLRLVDNTDTYRWYKMTLQVFFEGDKRIREIGTIMDVEDELNIAQQNLNSYDIDHLTGISTMLKFVSDAEELMNDNHDKEYAVIVFDIDKFKLINDLYNMQTGDRVLKDIVEIIKEVLPKGSLYGRMHADVFCMCVEYIKKGEIIKLIEKIRKEINGIEGPFDINTSYGIYLADEKDLPVNLMCDRARLAELSVKGDVVRFCAFYDEHYRNDILRVQEIERDMYDALRNRQFVMYLQPKYDLKTGKVVGAETLVRWNHPTKGMIQPNDFIPIFEKNGFILRLDEFMWEEACKTLRTWIDEGKNPVPLSVNISRYHIFHSDLEKILQRLLKKYKLDISLLRLEITETLFFENVRELYRILMNLQGDGFKLEVDDFGSGYSSLNMLRKVPVDTIKMDKNFLDETMNSDKGKIVVYHTIAMAKQLKLDVIAEGVETIEHVNFLKESNCDIAQGYYFARPMPLEEFNKLEFH